MRGMLAGFTTRGKSFLAAGIASAVCGLGLGERDLLRVGAMLFALPLLSALAASRTRYRLTCTRQVLPARVPAEQAAQASIRLRNVSRLRSGLLLAEDTVPYTLGSRPRFVLNGIEPGGARELHYQVRSELRGKFTIGPLQVRVADAFGLVELGRSFNSRSTLMVTPKVVPLPRDVIDGSWLGDGESRIRMAAAAGEDDIAPRAYRDGDELRRMHWRSTARYGELMVRREERQWRNRAVVFLDTRRSAHAGTGAASSFELAVSAAASVGVHLAREGFEAQLITDAGEVSAPGPFQDVLLDSLAIIRPSRSTELHAGLAAAERSGAGQVIAVTGRLSPAQAKRLATSSRGPVPAMALLLAVSTWISERPGDRLRDETDTAAGILRAAGWRVAIVTAGTPLATAWQLLHRPASGAPRMAVPDAAAARPVQAVIGTGNGVHPEADR